MELDRPLEGDQPDEPDEEVPQAPPQPMTVVQHAVVGNDLVQVGLMDPGADGDWRTSCTSCDRKYNTEEEHKM